MGGEMFFASKSFAFWLTTILCVLACPIRAADTNAAALEFFETKIRPVLAENCYSCHSAKAEKVKGGLKLDSREATLKGGDTGPAFVSGKPDQSLLIKAIRYTDSELRMPPKDKKLSPEQIADFEKWVAMGAPDPRTNNATTNQSVIDWTRARAHWAFKPIVAPPVPKVKEAKSVKSPLDSFALAKLEAKKLLFSPPADKRTLIRRATYDLVGLPPTPEEVADFERDKSTNAFTKVVDRLLASPHYGERWGRHWLDVARYADTKGYVGGNEEPRYPYAYTYRDWVVRAFNEDLPFDQFVIQQIAADQLNTDTNDNRSLAAMGFLTVGRRFLGNDNDVIDDRIDVVCRGLMGLTAGSQIRSDPDQGLLFALRGLQKFERADQRPTDHPTDLRRGVHELSRRGRAPAGTGGRLLSLERTGRAEESPHECRGLLDDRPRSAGHHELHQARRICARAEAEQRHPSGLEDEPRALGDQWPCAVHAVDRVRQAGHE